MTFYRWIPKPLNLNSYWQWNYDFHRGLDSCPLSISVLKRLGGDVGSVSCGFSQKVCGSRTIAVYSKTSSLQCLLKRRNRSLLTFVPKEMNTCSLPGTKRDRIWSCCRNVAWDLVVTMTIYVCITFVIYQGLSCILFNLILHNNSVRSVRHVLLPTPLYR